MYGSAQRCATETTNRLNEQFSLLGSPASVQTASVNRDTLNNEVIVIPVVVHILYNNEVQNISDAQVMSQIQSLNEDYRRLNADAVNTPLPFRNVAADTRIVFCLAKVDPNGRYTTGIIRKRTKEAFWLSDDQMKFSSGGGDDAWDSKKYLNIWVCNLFGRTLGYSVIPGGPANKDGVVLQYNVFGTTGTLNPEFNKGRTATHEIGHWLGLKHLWGDAQCGDDGVADTPPQQTNNSFCPTFPHTSSCSINNYGDMFMNFMDFTDDACMNMFTTGQKNLMRGSFALNHPRNSFLSSNVCDSSNVTAGPLPVETEQKFSVEIYPNPFTTGVTVKSANPGNLVGKKIKLYDVTGKVFSTQVLQSQNNIVRFPQLAPGIYFLKIEGVDRSMVFKLVKQSPGRN